MDIENILIEHWPRLKCANFFLLFSKNFTEISAVRVNLKRSIIDIQFEINKLITIDLTSIGLQIQVNSLSLLIVQKNLISFRANICNDDDNFHRELLNIPELPTIQNTLVKLPINIQPNENFQILCANCQCYLTDTLNFDRVLELPSENMDLSEWYCHKPMTNAEGGGTDDSSSHSQHAYCNIDNKNDDSTSIANNQKYNYTKFHPRRNDLLYGNFFTLFIIEHFQNKVRIDDDTKLIHCKRCLRHIGEMLRLQSIRIWNCNVKILPRIDNQNKQSEIVSLFEGKSMYTNFLFILGKILIDFEIVVAVAHQTQRIIFEAIGFDGRTRFLFVQIMAKNQEIFQIDRIVNDIINLKASNVMKVLFRCETNENQPLLQFWQNDVNVINSQISIEMYDCVVNKLYDRTKFVPEIFRENNGFSLSYIFRDDE